jgi:hypothetical protein
MPRTETRICCGTPLGLVNHLRRTRESRTRSTTTILRLITPSLALRRNSETTRPCQSGIVAIASISITAPELRLAAPIPILAGMPFLKYSR